MSNKLIKYLTLQEVEQLIKGAKDKKLKLALALGFGSGLRISEICGGFGYYTLKDGTREKRVIPPLSPENVDLDRHQIRILSGKGDKDRITVTSPWLNETNIKLLPLKIPIRTLQYQFNRLTERVLNKRCHFHQLRHGFGNYLVNEKNVPITQVQVLMGHSRIDTTAIYSKANPVQAVTKAWESF